MKKQYNSIDLLTEYQKCINSIDDFLEYNYKSYTKEEIREHIIDIIDKLTEALKAL